MQRTTPDGKSAPLPGVANPVRIAGEDTTHAKAPPLLGEDTDDVLASVLGLDAAAIADLAAEGVV